MRVDIPTGGPRRRFMRFVRPPVNTVGHRNTPLFPLQPSTRPLRVGLDVRTLPSPSEGDLLDLLRRADVEPFLLVQDQDVDPAEWMGAIGSTTVHRVSYSTIDQARRELDTVQVGVTTTEGGVLRRGGSGNFFDVYAQLDGASSARAIGDDDLDMEDRYRAAAFACAAAYLGIDALVTNAPTAGRADVADNDIVASVTPEELIPIFGHYLRCSGNHNIRITTGGLAGNAGTWTRTHSTGSISELYAAGIDSGMVHFDCLHLVAILQKDARLIAAMKSIRTRLGRAARALDALLAALTNTGGTGAEASDIAEAAAEAFDRELLYLCSAFDGFGRFYATLLDTTIDPSKTRDTLTSRTFLDRTLKHYPAANATDIEAGQKFAHICATLRHHIHASVLPAGHYLSRAYGSAKTVALDLTGLEYFDPATTTLDQDQIDRLGVWWADPSEVFGQPTYVADLATIATTLMVTALEYIDAFSRLVLCDKPTDTPRPHPALGCAPDTGMPLPPPTETELYHRRLFGWHGGVSVAKN